MTTRSDRQSGIEYEAYARTAMLICTAIFLGACASPRAGVEARRSGADQRTQDSSGDRSTGFDLLLEKLERVRPGDDYAKVVSVLGPPSLDQTEVRKETKKPFTRHVFYVKSQKEAGFLNPVTDEFLWLRFDAQQDRLRSIERNNIE
jgi:hypothetical protein